MSKENKKAETKFTPSYIKERLEEILVREEVKVHPGQLSLDI